MRLLRSDYAAATYRKSAKAPFISSIHLRFMYLSTTRIFLRTSDASYYYGASFKAHYPSFRGEEKLTEY